MSSEFVGAGWAFPIRTDSAGGIALVSGVREIEESMELILRTAPGERPMRPDFGCRIHDEIFAAVRPATIGRIAQDVREALARWEPRIGVTEVTISVDPNEASLLYIDISYTIRSTNDRRNLVFPYYTIPQEAE